MASVTRSTRRAEGLPHHHASAHGHGHHLTPSTAASAGLFHQAARSKRPLEGPEHDFDVIKPKRTRISVEILAKGMHNLGEAVRVPPAQPAAAPAPRPRPLATTVNPPPPPTTTPTVAPPAAKSDQNLTKHQAKVINGIKHELDRLQPQPTDTREQGRKLRSQEATRFKSELSAYFPEYDEVIGNDPKEHHLFNADTAILVVDSEAQRALSNSQSAVPRPRQADPYPARGYGDALFNDVFDAQRIDFSFLEAQYKNKTLDDPLPDKLFQPVHRRAERLERSIRNTEKGRAQHEKDQIIRLLEGLQGHDWLRVMGVSGITETKKKAFEPARDHFIKGCQAILAKFRNWILEERRRKAEKEKALAERAGDEDSGEDETDEEEAARGDSSDSASPAKQLREEAMARTKPPTKGSKKRRLTPQPPTAKQPAGAKAPAPKPQKPPKPPEPPKEFKSFFSKRYERDGALNRHRRAGRKVMAWGHPVPEIPEVDFDLPEDFLDADALKARERRKRRDRRGSKH
ncbi:something about silencing, SAS, complex subunit 4-domain-containing protein [Dactylonectria estremocensis]|uniref:Something about silencing, SAS, complex subunit 4-domain-containing protein n=1 Tax=Dactylonectria estremocensis TaxID=1079267 RepID=A0A9P9F8I1_9HYPO|nr:something about silencing, SAS, complex subunit 4-domain-containing protein [Dactylonectria estremocensis]